VARTTVQKVDPRARLLVFLTLLGALTFGQRVTSVVLLTMAVMVLAALSRLPLSSLLQATMAVLPGLLVVVLLQLALRLGDVPGCRLLLDWGPLRVSVCSAGFAFMTFLRFIGLLLLIALLVWSTSVPDLVRGAEGLLTPLNSIGLPGHHLAMVCAIALRFVPSMALEAERLTKAQAARGAALGRHRGNLVERVRRVLPLVVPLFVIALQRAERLAEALEARAYGLSSRGSRSRLRMRRIDWIMLGATISLVGIAWFIGWRFGNGAVDWLIGGKR
jgi:energy-coupling factor transport system permease protein